MAEEKKENVKQECPAYGKGFSEEVENCNFCKDEFPKDHEECRVLTQGGDQSAAAPVASETPTNDGEAVTPSVAKPAVVTDGPVKERLPRVKGVTTEAKAFADAIKAGTMNVEDASAKIAAMYVESGRTEKWSKARATLLLKNYGK